ncbi:peptidyl-prolyl cis-trans isomerase [Tundrisphaera lichenicola]|uniref:peptidylprolyl isomerase n=1 Tax=Tundrisphaera lichenicola TaxID=2029860 RepID=UPI003EC0A460
MDRRVVAGIVGMVLAAQTQASQAQVGPDPSGLPPVGLSTIPPLDETINGGVGISRFPRSSVPTDPRESGPAAVVPPAPVLPEPVSLTSEPPLEQSLRSGYRRSGLSSMIRGHFPFSGRPGPSSRRPAAPAPAPVRYSATRAASATPPRPQIDPTVVPSTLPEMPPIEDPVDREPSRPMGRPAPFAGQAPATARLQADPAVSTVSGCPAPLSEERPRVARPQVPGPASPRPRPAQAPSEVTLPAPPPLDLSPTPDLSTPPDLGAPPPAMAPGPVPVVEPIAPLPMPGMESASIPMADPEIRRVNGDPTALRMTPERPKELPFATLRAAAVGDEIITIQELNAVVAQRLEELKGSAPPSESDRRQFINMVAAHSLDNMIDQAVILQEARRKMSNPKAQKGFDDFIDKKWREDELPPLLNQTNSANEYELKRKLAEQGKSYEALKASFHKKVMAHEFLNSQIQNKVTCDLAEQRAFYNEHLSSFEQPARFSWREIEISCDKYPSRAEARKQAEAALARLLRDEDFAAVAKAVSSGPTASQGGLYVDMTPGSYGISVVNQELDRLPVGQISTILEAPGTFHIVRVESRREAGPLRFDEVQDKIKPMVMQQNYQKAVETYLEKLRARTLIRTMFDKTESDPQLARQKDSSIQPVSTR